MPYSANFDEQIQNDTDKPVIEPASFASRHYWRLLNNTEFAALLELLADSDLGKLMHVPYFKGTSQIAGRFGRALEDESVRTAIAQQLDTIPERLTTLDYARVIRLNLADTDIFSLDPVAELTNLEELNIAGTNVSNLEPIRNMVNLKALYIGDTRVSDLEPISQLPNLTRLSAWRLPVSDWRSLNRLTSLEALIVPDNEGINDLEFIARMIALRFLNISKTSVAYLHPISSLHEIRELSLSETRISDLSPLASLGKLVYLNISFTEVSDISPLTNLQNLEVLELSGLKLSSLDIINELLSLRQLRIIDCGLDNEEIRSMEQSRPTLQIISRT